LDDCRCRLNQSQTRLDGGAEAGNLCSRYTALVCGGSEGEDDRGLPYVKMKIIFLACIGIGKGCRELVSLDFEI